MAEAAEKKPDAGQIEAYIFSAKAGDDTAVTAFLDEFPDFVDATMDNLKTTALILAVDNHHASTRRLLLARRARPSAETRDGTQAIHVAIWHDDVAALEDLLAAGADIEAFDGKNQPPLLSAVLCGKHASVLFLLARGANLAATTDLGNTVWDMVDAKDKKMLEILDAERTRRNDLTAKKFHQALPRTAVPAKTIKFKL